MVGIAVVSVRDTVGSSNNIVVSIVVLIVLGVWLVVAI